MKLFNRPLPFFSLLALLSVAGGGALYAQLEGAERGVPPIESQNTFEVTGVEVDVAADSAEEARQLGWRIAQRKGWKALWASTKKRPQSEAPDLTDSELSSMVSGIIVEHEQIGPKRYIARLGVLFDRSRSGELLGVSGYVRRSHPVLVIPVMITGSSAQSFESRNEWQKAWARFRTVSSPVDYVRPSGSGIDPLLLNLAQTKRPGRGWWRMLMEQYGTSDVVVPQVHLRRLYPGGPAIGVFTARHGPDNELIERIVLRVENSGAIPRMMDEGVRRLDAAYTRALAAGMLEADPSLEIPEPEPAPEIEAETDPAPPTVATAPIPGMATSFAIQVDTPTPESVSEAEISVSQVSGVSSALTTSLALGGTSVMRVTYAADAATLAASLQAQGWNVQVTGENSLRISR